MSSAAPGIYRFGEFELEAGERRLRRGGEPVALTPKAFDLLVLLVEHEGRVISKDELMHALWPRSIVIESNLTKHVWMVRRALGEADGGGRYIQTVSKLGYRFAAPVTKGSAKGVGKAERPESV
ncbi:MAG: transcriptional regulator, partial [Caulobacteraceae bacterium]